MDSLARVEQVLIPDGKGLLVMPSGMSLFVLAHIGMVCGPCREVVVGCDEGCESLAIARVDPVRRIDPVIPIPMVEADAGAWAALREFYELLREAMECVGRMGESWAHERAVKQVDHVVARFSRYLDQATLQRLRLWLGVSLLGMARVNVIVRGELHDNG